MFRRFAKFLTDAGVNGPEVLMRLHPSELSVLLELAWDNRSDNKLLALGDPARRSDVPGLFGSSFGTFFTSLSGAGAAVPATNPFVLIATELRRHFIGTSVIGRVSNTPGGLYDHLIYAYMIENTRIYEIFRRVVFEFVHGEKLGVPGSGDSQKWLRTTEELFFREPPPFFITAVTGYVRPDIHATRRNAYQRMFDMNLNHGTDDNKPYPYVKAEAANNNFIATFEEFVREVWIGIENFNNSSGAKPTDDAKIADLAEKLFDMLMTRRQTGNLSREEFVFVSWMSWFHLTVDSNLPVILDLRAQATSPEERLFKIAQRVGLPAHGLSKHYFDIADSISRILIEIETGKFNDPLAVPALYTPAPGGPNAAMLTIIRHWSIITGREMKARKVTPT
ncbi:MAG: hypothetical protein L0Y60_17950 [Beijerinckiaceae bacterium]|nr:hypothetical protein [Beijerinckiaceae bacterium]